MLAYVFWHRPRVGVDRRGYELALLDFQLGLLAARPAGLVDAGTLRVGPAPWTGSEPAYEDWYLVDGFACLGELNEAAVSAQLRQRHDRAAGQAGWGAGGVYGLRLGPAHPGPGSAHWLRKPAGMPYADLDRLLAPALRASTALWQRQLVLGPAPEFCLVDPAPLDLPAVLAAVHVERSALGPG